MKYDRDPLAAARGCLLAIVIGLCFWALVGTIVWMFTH